MSNLTQVTRSFQVAAWKLARQRRTLHWRRHEQVGYHYPADRLSWSPADATGRKKRH